jgi:hypothetical protein
VALRAQKRGMEYQKKHNTNIVLIQNGEPDAYLYRKKDLVIGKYIFGEWYDTIMALKEEMKKEKENNLLLKHLLSSCWAFITGKHNK